MDYDDEIAQNRGANYGSAEKTKKPALGLTLDEDDDFGAHEGGEQRFEKPQHDYCIEIIGKLWSLLDEPGDH